MNIKWKREWLAEYERMITLYVSALCAFFKSSILFDQSGNYIQILQYHRWFTQILDDNNAYVCKRKKCFLKGFISTCRYLFGSI